MLKSNEPLPYMRFVVVVLIGNNIPIIKKVKFGAIGFGAFLVIMQLSSFVVRPALKMIPLTSFYFYITLSMFCSTFLMDTDRLIDHQTSFCLPLDNAGLETKQHIFGIGKFEDGLAIMSIVLIIYLDINLVGITEIRNGDFIWLLIEEYCPVIKIGFTMIMFIWTTIAIPFEIGWPFTFFYFSWHLQFQVKMLRHYVTEISTDFKNYTFLGGLVRDEKYQKIVRERLKNIITRHGEMLRAHEKMMNYLNIKITSTIMGVAGACIGFTPCWMLLVKFNLITIALTFMIFLIILEMVIRSGQQYEDTFLDLFNAALDAPWYEWNAENKRAYVMLLQQSRRLVPFTFFHRRYNRDFQIYVLKFVYSIGTLILRTQTDLIGEILKNYFV